MNWSCYAAAVIGEDHVASGQPRQDMVGRWAGDQLPAIALADGLGSSPHSRKGAQAAVKAALHALRWWQQLPGAPIEPVIRALYQRWLMELGNTVKEEAKSTVLAAAVGLSGDLLTVQLGDGVLLLELENGVRPHSDGKPTDFVNETMSLGGAMNMADWQWSLHAPGVVRGVVLASDGVANGLDPNAWHDFCRHLRVVRGNAPDSISAEVALRRQLKEWPMEAAGGDDRSVACMFLIPRGAADTTDKTEH